MGYPRNMVSAKPLCDFLRDNGSKVRVIAEIIGVAPSTLSGYTTGGTMPKYMMLCIEALERRMKGSSAINMKEARAEMSKDMDKLLDEILMLRTKYRSD